MYSGKKIDLDKFIDGLAKYFNGDISMRDFGKEMGVSTPTIKARVKYYVEHGDLKDEWFNDLKERRKAGQRVL